MMKSPTIVQTPNAPQAIGPYSQAIVHHNIVYCSGQIGMNAQTGELVEAGLDAQIHQVMNNLQAVLQEAGSDLNKVLKCSIFLDDMAHFKRVNEIYGEYFTENRPARETMAVKSLPKNAMVEISCMAYL